MSRKIQELQSRLRGMAPADSTERVDLLLELAHEHFSGDDPPALMEVGQGRKRTESGRVATTYWKALRRAARSRSIPPHT